MIGQTTPPTQQITGLSPQEAFVCLLIAGARADGAVSPHEANQIEHVAAGMRLFHDSSYETRRSIFMAAAERINAHGLETVVRVAASAIPGELGATTFALAIDLMLADGHLTANEKRFADELRGLLNVDGEMAAKIVEVLAVKNAG